MYGAGIRDYIKKNNLCSFLRNSTCFYEFSVYVWIGMEIKLWYVCYFPGTWLFDLKASGSAWFRLMKTIYFPSILQKGSDEITLNLWILLRKMWSGWCCVFIFVLNYVNRSRETELFSELRRFCASQYYCSQFDREVGF